MTGRELYRLVTGRHNGNAMSSQQMREHRCIVQAHDGRWYVDTSGFCIRDINAAGVMTLYEIWGHIDLCSSDAKFFLMR